jgi:hypothetical protein
MNGEVLNVRALGSTTNIGVRQMAETGRTRAGLIVCQTVATRHFVAPVGKGAPATHDSRKLFHIQYLRQATIV